MKENYQTDPVRKIKKAFLSAFDYLGHESLDDKNRVIKAIKGKHFYTDWLQHENNPPLVRALGGWDTAHWFLKGLLKVFAYGGFGLLAVSGVLAVLTLLFVSSPIILMSLVVFSMAAGIGGICFLGAGVVFGLLSFIPRFVVNKLDHDHHTAVIIAVLEVTDIRTLDGKTYIRDFGFLVIEGLNNTDSEFSNEYSEMEDLLSTKKSNPKLDYLNLSKRDSQVTILNNPNQNKEEDVNYKPKTLTMSGGDDSDD